MAACKGTGSWHRAGDSWQKAGGWRPSCWYLPQPHPAWSQPAFRRSSHVPALCQLIFSTGVEDRLLRTSKWWNPPFMTDAKKMSASKILCLFSQQPGILWTFSWRCISWAHVGFIPFSSLKTLKRWDVGRRLELGLYSGSQKSWPCFHKKYMEAGVMTFQADCTCHGCSVFLLFVSLQNSHAELSGTAREHHTMVLDFACPSQLYTLNFLSDCIKCIRLGSVRSSHLPFKMNQVVKCVQDSLY